VRSDSQELAPSLTAGAVAILQTPDAVAKAEQSRALATAWRSGRITELGDTAPPMRPARPERPRLGPPREVPRRRINRGTTGRIALLHALAHIELNAIDLAWDILARFVRETDRPQDFANDWLRVADEEAKHFMLLQHRLETLGSTYGAFTAHDGLWESAAATSHDLAARLAVVPLVLEARGLDVTPAMTAKLRAAEDTESAAILDIIHRDEITHVAVGHRWFEAVCRARGNDPADTFKQLVRRYFKGAVKPPFNRVSREEAGLTPDFYEALAGAPSPPEKNRLTVID
jgi:uncharacterized ferritin-like protein (DUF455 family)